MRERESEGTNDFSKRVNEQKRNYDTKKNETRIRETCSHSNRHFIHIVLGHYFLSLR